MELVAPTYLPTVLTQPARQSLCPAILLWQLTVAAWLHATDRALPVREWRNRQPENKAFVRDKVGK